MLQDRYQFQRFHRTRIDRHPATMNVNRPWNVRCTASKKNLFLCHAARRVGTPEMVRLIYGLAGKF